MAGMVSDHEDTAAETTAPPSISGVKRKTATDEADADADVHKDQMLLLPGRQQRFQRQICQSGAQQDRLQRLGKFLKRFDL